MTHSEAKSVTSLNARVGALSLAVGGPLNLLLHLQGVRLAPLGYASWLAVSFGVLSFCEEMGAARPLNRAGAVFFAAAFCADTFALLATDPVANARARLLYAFCILAALLFWSVSLMHRARFVRAIGSVGVAVGGAALALLVAAHVLVGAVTIAGFSQLFTALDGASRSGAGPLLVINSVLCIWALTVAALLWKGRLRDQA